MLFFYFGPILVQSESLHFEEILRAKCCKLAFHVQNDPLTF